MGYSCQNETLDKELTIPIGRQREESATIGQKTLEKELIYGTPYVGLNLLYSKCYLCHQTLRARRSNHNAHSAIYEKVVSVVEVLPPPL
ncbi:hypothetical protein L204_102579 [Cryptococcus depauperatus]